MICQLCGGVLVLLGLLGNLAWFRCRQCGMEFSKRLTPEEIEDLNQEETP